MLIWINVYIVVMVLYLIFGDDLRTSMHIDNKEKYILIIGKGPTQGLDDTTLTVVAQYSINFSRSNRKFCLSLHYNWGNSFLFVNAAKKDQFQGRSQALNELLQNITQNFHDGFIIMTLTSLL